MAALLEGMIRGLCGMKALSVMCRGKSPVLLVVYRLFDVSVCDVVSGFERLSVCA